MSIRKLYIAFCLLVATCAILPACSFAQSADIVSPVTNKTFKLPNPASLQNADDARNALASAENAAKALAADAGAEKPALQTAEGNYNKAEAIRNNYVAALNNFSTKDVEPYKAELKKYSETGDRYTTTFTTYNKAAAANNALPTNSRKPGVVAALTKQKKQLEATGAKLGKWQKHLDSVKTKLDVKNAALQKQEKDYESANQAAVSRLKILKARLLSILNQLNQCAAYNNKYMAVAGKFNATVPVGAGYFDSQEYKGAVAGLDTELIKLKQLPGV